MSRKLILHPVYDFLSSPKEKAKGKSGEQADHLVANPPIRIYVHIWSRSSRA
jgi:hypothetical protein